MTTAAFLDATLLARTANLSLLAQRVVEGSLHGLHLSRQLGAGMEFNQYRPYEPGDDPRQLDWKLYARSDKLFIRQSERESHVKVRVVLDTSASMAQPSNDIDNWTRFDCARHIAACALAIAERQGDGYGWMGLNAHDRSGLPIGHSKRHLDRCLVALENAVPQGAWPSETQLDTLWDAFSPPGLVVLISDFYQQRNEVLSLAQKLRAAGNDVLALQLVTRQEVSFPYRGSTDFLDRETGQRVQTHARSVRERYRLNFEQAHETLRAGLAAHGIALHRATIETPLDHLLTTFVNARDVVAHTTRLGAA
ncbi:MAG: DUF58 domain-containing protein [Gammaproteobacteria bacterium]